MELRPTMYFTFHCVELVWNIIVFKVPNIFGHLSQYHEFLFQGLFSVDCMIYLGFISLYTYNSTARTI